MISWNTIQDALADWVRTASGLDAEHVYWTQQKRPIPEGKYITLRLFSSKQNGLDWTKKENNFLVISDMAIDSVDDTTNRLVRTGHGLLTGDGPIRFTTSGVLPSGIELATDYWIIRINADEFQIAESINDAFVPTPIDFLDDGTGTLILVDTDHTYRYGLEIKRSVSGPRACVLSLQCFGGTPKGSGQALATLEEVRSHLNLNSVHLLLIQAGIGMVPDSMTVQSTDGFIGSTVFEPRAIGEVRFNLISEVSDFSTFVESVELTNELTGIVTEIELPQE